MKAKLNFAGTLFRSIFLAGILGTVCLQAFEFRTPLLLEHGPLRLLSEEEDSGFGLRYWSAFYQRDAHKAFTDNHGTKTQDIAALFMHSGTTPSGEAPFDGGFTFRTTEMFKDRYVPTQAANYNPLLRTAKLRLSARYSEYGAVLGTSWDMPVVENRGRVGIRASIPVKKIKVQKVDMEGVRQGAELQDVLSVQVASNSSTESDKAPGSRLILVRSDFAEALVQSKDLNQAVNYAATYNGTAGAVEGPGAEKVYFGASGTGGRAFPTLNGVLLSEENSAVDATRNVAVIYSPEGIVPREDDSVRSFVQASQVTSSSSQTADDISDLGEGAFAVFVAGNDYSSLAETGNKSLAVRKDMQETKANLWLCPIIAREVDPTATNADNFDGVIRSTGDTDGIFNKLKTLSEQVTENVYEWLHDNQVDLETYTREGFGDLDFDVYYSHIFNNQFGAEAFIGFQAPTGGRRKRDNNPYRVTLGNGGHWVIKAGGMGHWTPNNIFGFKVSGYYGFALSDTEERPATFSNTSIKLGPSVDADVKWDYLVANFDINLSHMSAKDITGLLGYQIYYKRKDSVTFAKTSTESWLGKKYDSSTKTWGDFELELDPLLSEANTNVIAHKFRFEASFIMTDWMELFAGGAWTFAGRNTLRSTDVHVGFNVAF